jgi:hypothetical protein
MTLMTSALTMVARMLTGNRTVPRAALSHL